MNSLGAVSLPNHLSAMLMQGKIGQGLRVRRGMSLVVVVMIALACGSGELWSVMSRPVVSIDLSRN